MRSLDDPPVLAVHDSLVGGGLLAPLGRRSEEQAWMDCELASFAEHNLGDPTCPRQLDEARREVWQTRATDERLSLPSRREFERCFWILHQGRPVGTVALANSTLGGVSVRLSSLYVYPEHRGHAIGRRTVERIRDELHAAGMALRLSTNWTWQSAVRLYVRMGLAVHGWKRELDFRAFPGESAPEVVIAGDRASVFTTAGGIREEVLEAERKADRLILRVISKDDRRMPWDALSSLALALALEGWPLIRSQEHWERARGSDLGPPEALAYKISVWEAWARKHGWRVETRPIPGLHYPTWDALENLWEEQRKVRETSSEAPESS